MTDHAPEPEAPTESTSGVGNEQLPDDLRPGSENPLAEPLDHEQVDRDLEMDGTQESLDEVRSEGPAEAVADTEDHDG